MDAAISKPEYKIAAIMDDMVFDWFKFECSIIRLGTGNWQQLLETEKPDLLFVHSAWEGSGKQWYLKICDIELTGDQTLTQVVSWCKENGIPTVFWNMEDPYHFDHFIHTAKLFDFVFTTDSNCIPRYKQELGHNNVFTLPFAAQPKIHNPLGRDGKQNGPAAFAGTWYKNGHEDRKKDMEIVLKPAFKHGLHIYDRMSSYTRSDIFRYPPEYAPYLKEGVPYSDMTDIYKKYKVFLNVNTVQNSPTMFACRVLELLACGTNVVSGYALGIEKMLPGLVSLCKSPEDTARNLDILLRNKEIRDRRALLGQREVFSKNTYRHRLETVLKKTKPGIDLESEPGVSVITCSNRPGMDSRIIANYRRQKYPVKELIVVNNHGHYDSASWAAKVSKYKNVKVFNFDGSKTLAECLNFGVTQAIYDYISKFDDDNYYAPHYLTDLMHAFKYTNADIVGKRCCFVYFKDTKELAMRHPGNEYIYTNILSGGALVINKEVFQQCGFFGNPAKGTVTRFLKKCVNNGFRVFSADRFNYVYLRESSGLNHTWNMDRDECLRKSKVVLLTNDYLTHTTV